MDKTTEYLRLLQEKNRLKKLMQTKSKDEQQKEELEKGFTTHFRGAHATKDVKNQPPVATAVKPINILSRIAQSRFGWGSERKSDNPSNENNKEHAQDTATKCNSVQVQQGFQEDRSNYNEYESDFENFSDTEYDTGGAPAKLNPMASVKEVSEEQERKGEVDFDVTAVNRSLDLNGTTALDASLQVRVKDLSAAQKIKLLKLLEQDVGTNIDDKDLEPNKRIHAISPKRNKPSVSGNSSPSPSPGRSSPLQHNIKHSSITPKQQSISTIQDYQQQQSQLNHNSKHCNDVDVDEAHADASASVTAHADAIASVTAHADASVSVTAHVPALTTSVSSSRTNKQVSSSEAVISHTTTRPSYVVSLRLRITSTWNSKARSVSLDAIRLRRRNRVSGDDENCVAEELLQSLSSKILSGMMPLPATHESVRGLDTLLGTRSVVRPMSSYKRGSTSWKAPCAPDNALELLFEGNLSSLAEEDALDIELCIWNARSPPLNCGAARDVDVFVGSKCVWSGQLEEPLTLSDSSFAQQTGVYGKEETPSIVLFPFSNQTLRNAPERSYVSQEIPRIDTLHEKVPYTSKLLEGTGKKEAECSGGGGDQRPNWLPRTPKTIDPTTANQTSNGSIPAVNHIVSEILLEKDESAKRPQSGTRQRRVRSETTTTVAPSPAPAEHNMEETLCAADQLNSPIKSTPKRNARRPRRREDPAVDRSPLPAFLPTSTSIINRREIDDDMEDEEGKSLGGSTKPIDGGVAPTVDGGAPDSPVQRNTRHRVSRRDRGGVLNHLPREHRGKGNSQPAYLEGVIEGFSPDVGISQAKQRELDLKKSLDSLAFHDKFNLGRLSASKLPQVKQQSAGSSAVPGDEDAGRAAEDTDEALEAFLGTLDESHAPQTFANDSLDTPDTPGAITPPRSGQLLQNYHQEYQLQFHQNPSPAKKANSEYSKSSPLRATVSETGLRGDNTPTRRADKDIARTAKIDLVQEKINSTIAGLAHIMSGFPSSTTATGGAGSASALSTSPAHTKVDAGDCCRASKRGGVCGKILTIEVHSNWGDAHYIGLNGIELYGPTGHLFTLASPRQHSKDHGNIATISTCPADLNVFPDSSDDPRRATNLLDGVNFTKNDMHSWLAPQLNFLKTHHTALADSLSSGVREGCLAIVSVEFDREVELAMCRIFNYNRSRVRNQRGARWCKVLLDGNCLWEGEVKKASGQLASAESESQVVFLAVDMDQQRRDELHRHLVVCPGDQQVITAGVTNKEGGGEEEIDLEQSWAEMSMSRPRTSAGIPPAVVAAAATTLVGKTDANDKTTVSTADAASSDIGTAAAVMRVGDENAFPANELKEAALRRVLGEFGVTHTSSSSISKEVGVVPVPTNSVRPVVPVTFSTPSSASAGAGPAEGDGSGEPCRTAALMTCRVLRIDIDSTWGDPNYVGLCGVEVLLGARAVPAKLNANQLTAVPKDLSDIGCFDDPRVLANLLNSVNNTADDTKMWIIPFTRGSEHFLQIDLMRPQEVAGLRFWNYNKASEHVLRGCRNIRISADGKQLFRCLLRPGPGCDGVRFEQDVLFADLLDVIYTSQNNSNNNGFCKVSSTALGTSGKTRPSAYITPPIRQDYETPSVPAGMMWRFTLFDNYNDQYFIGLDAIQFFDPEGRLIDICKLGAHIQAVPFSVQDVQQSTAATAAGGAGSNIQDSAPADPRQPAQLVLGAGRALGCGWLAPLARCMTPAEKAVCARRILPTQSAQSTINTSTAYSFPLNNVVVIMFPQPVAVSAIKLFNYSKTPNRGVRDFMIEVDGLYLYMGTLLRFDREKTSPQTVRSGIPAHSATLSRGQSVLFSGDVRITQAHKETVNYCGSTEQDLLCINERQVMVRSRGMYDQEPPNTSLEGVRSDLQKRPMTAAQFGPP